MLAFAVYVNLPVVSNVYMFTVLSSQIKENVES